MEIFGMLIILIFALIVIMGLIRFIENENSPVLTERAVLVKKINNTTMDANGTMHTDLLLKFDIGGSILKCPVNGRVYRQMQEGMDGMLTHQGTRFKCFEVDGIKIEK